jgi:predicted RNA-binding Zn-ribbon protein involved in translation (DUF1610 family)
MKTPTCGNCEEIMCPDDSPQCGHPMVYVNHSTNKHHVTLETPACGYYHAAVNAKTYRVTLSELSESEQK